MDWERQLQGDARISKVSWFGAAYFRDLTVVNFATIVVISDSLILAPISVWCDGYCL